VHETEIVIIFSLL